MFLVKSANRPQKRRKYIMPRIGFPELIVILVIALVLFGPGKLPAMGKAVGEALKEFKKATGEIMGGNNTVVGTETNVEARVEAPMKAKAPDSKLEAKVEDIEREDVK